MACLGEWKGGDGKDDARQQPDELSLLFWMHEKPYFLFWPKKATRAAQSRS